jgi:fatty-acyl-CoA synthase
VSATGWTLPRALEAAARTRSGVHFVQEDGRESFESYEELRLRASSIARHLAELGVRPGHRVALLIPEAEGFIPSLFGVSMIGAVAVPLAPPMNLAQLGAALESWRRMARIAEVRAVVTTSRLRAVLGTLPAAVPTVGAVVCWDDLGGDPGDVRADVRPQHEALVQFTSGSTSRPKGVVLAHESLGANVEAITGPAGIDVSAHDVGVSWLPLFHDMGLIGVVIGSVNAGSPLVLLPPLLFLKRPGEWLRAITRHHGTMSFAPNFAYDLCVRRARPLAAEDLDLSTWRVAGCGAEPVRSATLETFAATFAAAGFRRTSFLPCYGLAEHALAATFHRHGEEWRADHVRADALRLDGRAVPGVAGDPSACALVGCGRPFPGHEVRVVGESDRPLPERHVGEIQLRGPSVMTRYQQEPELSEDTLRGGWLRTGDLGYIADGDLFVCGRRKELVIVHGKNYYPQDLEWAAGAVAGVRRGSVVAFGLHPVDGPERVVIVAECRGRADADRVRAGIIRAVQESCGLTVHDVVVVARGSLPKTTSGKLQRARVKSRYENGGLLSPAPRPRGLVRHLLQSRWGYAKAALRRAAFRLGSLRGEHEGAGT